MKTNYAVGPSLVCIQILVLRVFHELMLEMALTAQSRTFGYVVPAGLPVFLDSICDKVVFMLSRTPREALTITFVRKAFIAFLESEYAEGDPLIQHCIKALKAHTS